MPEKLDYKKEFKELYQPKKTPSLVDVPKMRFIMVEGAGDPNEESGEYQKAVEALYSLSYTIKMNKKGDDKPKDYFEYVVPPLEGLWWMDDSKEIDYKKKNSFHWIAMIRQPGFVTDQVFNSAVLVCRKKKPDVDTSKAKLLEFCEGSCVQILHIGSYDDEPETMKLIEKFIDDSNLKKDLGTKLPDGFVRHHHEIYLSDPRKVATEKRKTVLRIPVKKY